MMMGDEEYLRSRVDIWAQSSPRAGLPKLQPEPGCPNVGTLDTRGGADPPKGAGTPDPRPPPQEWGVPRDWALAGADPAAPEDESVC